MMNTKMSLTSKIFIVDTKSLSKSHFIFIFPLRTSEHKNNQQINKCELQNIVQI